MVERRDQVLIGRLSFDARAVSTFCTRWWSTNGPFLMERAICPYLYLPWRLRAHMLRGRLLRRGRFLPWVGRPRRRKAALPPGATLAPPPPAPARGPGQRRRRT